MYMYYICLYMYMYIDVSVHIYIYSFIFNPKQRIWIFNCYLSMIFFNMIQHLFFPTSISHSCRSWFIKHPTSPVGSNFCKKWPLLEQAAPRNRSQWDMQSFLGQWRTWITYTSRETYHCRAILFWKINLGTMISQQEHIIRDNQMLPGIS